MVHYPKSGSATRAMIVFALQLSLVIGGASLNFALWVGSFATH